MLSAELQQDLFVRRRQPGRFARTGYVDGLHLGLGHRRRRPGLIQLRRGCRPQQLLAFPRFQQNIGAVDQPHQTAIRAELQQGFLAAVQAVGDKRDLEGPEGQKRAVGLLV
ncbi:hypothetical protein G6F35_017927 [Rhizopus arrhizus]|nr:hypothetical protein G6F35_017927 [Rhizopus arrhizus]